MSFDSFRSLILPALLAGFSSVSFAGTLSVSGSAPAVDGEDIANPNPGSASDAGGDQGHIWSNRPLQGQTFTTGGLAGGYLLKSVTLQNLNNNIGSSAVFTVRVGTVSGTVFSVVHSESTTNSVSYSPNDYITFTFTTPIALSPNTVYGFDWDATGSGFVTTNLPDASYAGGVGFSNGGGGTPNDSALVFRTVDRIFHADLDGVAPNGVADIANLAATAITADSAQLNGEVLDIGDTAPSIIIRWGDEDGGGNTGAWDHADALPGTQGVGNFSATTGTTLLPNTTYFFRAFASNTAGDSEASSSLSFTTLPAAPTVTNIAASNLAADSATVGGTVTDTGGEAPTLFIYWGPSDGGTTAGSWQNSVLLGAQSGSTTTGLTGLNGGTTYFYRAFVTNNGGSAWAATSASFTTQTPQPPSVINDSANGITGSSANLRGEITNTGFEAPTVSIYYGETDGGIVTGAWDSSVNLGVQDGSFSFFLTGLDPLADYFYRAVATNSAGTTWSPSSETFTTTEIVANTVVINEIHYDHDPKTEFGEFVELFNASDSAIDLSFWTLNGAVDFQFPGGTTIPANGFLVVAENPAVLLSRFGVVGLGPYSGKLSNDGERLELEDGNGVTVDEVTYGIGFPWPSASRGKGPSMELINADLDNDLGSSWRSAQSGFSGPQVTYVSAGENWSYRKGTSEASTPTDVWREQGFFEDASWLSGDAVIGYGDGDDTTLLNDMQGSYSSVYMRKEFNVSGTIPSQVVVRVYYDDGAIVWVNGDEVARV